jgi:hypothetical protein
MDTAVASALVEIAAAIAALAPAHEGLRDFARLNLQPAAALEVKASLEQCDRRAKALEHAQTALDLLVADGYPALPLREVNDTAFADLLNNAATIAAALARFVGPEPATAMGLSGGAVLPK